MRRSHSRWTAVSLALVSLCAGGIIGCETNPAAWFGSNASYNFIVPAGFGGNPGAFNPFGITQAIVNAILGVGSSSSSTSSSSSSSGAASTAPDAGTLVTVVNQ